MTHSSKAFTLFAQTLAGTGLAANALSGHAATPGKNPDVNGAGETQKQSWPTFPQAPKGAPNVVVILLDDVGFAATSAFGGPAHTPALEKLAAEGLRYNQFHTTALSSPTRAALLSGRNHHQLGFGVVAEIAESYPGYNTVWPKSAAPVTEVLRRNGYSTAGFGKWHNTPMWETGPAGPFDRWPSGLGFEYYYGFQGGETSMWEPPLFRNNAFVEPPATPAQGYHLTTDITNDAIGWLHSHQANAPTKPYFLYFAPGAVHAPHHVPAKWIEKYRGKFDRGWDKLREEIFARQKAAGIIPAGTELTPRPAELPAWDSLSEDEKRLLSRQAEVFAAFLEHTDYEIGRLLDAVRAGPSGDNTLVMYVVGDNGGSAEGGLGGADINIAAQFLGIPNPLSEQLQHIDELGSEKWDNHFSVAWAWATDTPFQWTKQVASHFGGTRNGFVVSWPSKVKARGEVRSQFSHVNDIAPTIYQATGIQLPAVFDGVQQLPLEGSSLVPTFSNANAPSQHRRQYFEMFGNRAIYQDGWVAGARHGVPWQLSGKSDDFESDRWELYHVSEDFSQAHDLATKQPEKLAELKREFDSEARRNLVYPLHNGVALKSVISDKPTAYGNATEFVYHADQAPLAARHGVPLLTRAHRFEADLQVPAGGADGVIVSQGGRLGGFSLFVKNGRLAYANNFFSKAHEELTAPQPLPTGDVRVAVSFAPQSAQPWAGGTVKLEVNGAVVAQHTLTNMGVPQLSETLDIGRDRGSAVSEDYQAPFVYGGVLKQVRLKLQ